MIVPMIKYNFLIHHTLGEKFLESLSDAGVMDITVSDYVPTQEQSDLAGEIASVAGVAEKLKQRRAGLDPKEIGIIDMDSSKDAVDFYITITAVLEQLKSQTIKLKKEADEVAMWGEYSAEMIQKLEQAGVKLRFFMVLAKEYDSAPWRESLTTTLIAERNGMVLFAIVQREGDDLSALESLGEMKLPSYTYYEKMEDLELVTGDIEVHEYNLNSLTSHLDSINQYKSSLEDQLDFSKARSTSQSAAEGHLTLVEGWVPKEECDKVDSIFTNMAGVVMVKEEPTLEDEPPVLLKNGRFARMAELVTNLYSLPKYHAMDLTPYFAPWFIFFVGICFADVFYGMVTLALGIFLISKSKKEGKGSSTVGELVVWCSASTIVMGFITGNAGGIPLADTQMFEPIKWIFLGQTDMFSFAIGVGILQILYGMCVKAYARAKRFGFLYSLSTIGWASVIVATILAFALPEVGVDFSTSSVVYKVILWVGLGMSVLLHDPSKNIFASAGAGLWELYNSITGLFSDTLSYIRLFALGLSGGIIASVFNDLAVGMSGDIPVVKYIIMLLILLVGHGINLFMSAIGSFVHPLRLTFVEFYNNADFEAGGRAYNPFARRGGAKEIEKKNNK